MTDLSRFDGRVVLVTGGASGIGQAAARRFAELGATVRIVSRAAEGEGSLSADLRDPGQAAAAVQAVVDELGRLDVLVNNAGIFRTGGVEADVEESLDVMLTNVLAPAYVARAAVDALAVAGGVIVNVSSALAQLPVAGSAFYAASKAALESLTRSWAAELAPRRIRVNAVAPGPTNTPVLLHAGLDEEQVAAGRRAIAQRLPLGRVGDADEVAAWIVELASERGAWITGSVITVDGGLAIA